MSARVERLADYRLRFFASRICEKSSAVSWRIHKRHTKKAMRGIKFFVCFGVWRLLYKIDFDRFYKGVA